MFSSKKGCNNYVCEGKMFSFAANLWTKLSFLFLLCPILFSSKYLATLNVGGLVLFYFPKSKNCALLWKRENVGLHQTLPSWQNWLSTALPQVQASYFLSRRPRREAASQCGWAFKQLHYLQTKIYSSSHLYTPALVEIFWRFEYFSGRTDPFGCILC